MNMKKLVVIAILSVVVHSGCKKGQQNPKSTGLIATWELRSEIGGIAGTHNVYQPGTGNILQLNADSTFASYRQFKLVSEGGFGIIKSAVLMGQTKYDLIFFNNNMASGAIQLKGDTLIIGMDFDDGIASTYVRK
jgi:hypothetical protein